MRSDPLNSEKLSLGKSDVRLLIYRRFRVLRAKNRFLSNFKVYRFVYAYIFTSKYKGVLKQNISPKLIFPLISCVYRCFRV